MCCKNLGIGLTVLSVTLFFGIAIGEISKLNDLPEIAVVEDNILTFEETVLKDCVPADPNLKYHFTGEDNKKAVVLKVKNTDDFKNFITESKDDSGAEKESKRIEKEAERYSSSFQKLVFAQKCGSEKDSQ